MKRVRVGIIGTGFGQNVHLPAFRTHPECEVVALCGSRMEHVRDIAARHGVAGVFDNWRELLRADVDAVSLAVPPALQFEIALQAVAAGKAIFCEKPLAATLAQAEELTMAAQRAGVAGVVDFEFLETAPWREAARMIAEGRIGKLRQISIGWHLQTHALRQGLASWKTSADTGGGCLLHFVSHVFYYLEQLAGRIISMSARLGFPSNRALTADSSVSATLATQGGTLVSLCVNTDLPCGRMHRVEIFGDQGVLCLKNRTADHLRGFRLAVARGEHEKLEPVAVDDDGDPWKDGRIAPVARLAGRFLDGVRTGAPVTPHLQDGLRVQRLLDAARRSHDDRRWVDVSASGE